MRRPPVTRSIFCMVRGENGCLPGEEPPASGDMAEADQAFGENLLENVNEAHKYVFRLSTAGAALPIILEFVYSKMFLKGGEDASCVFSGMCCAVTVGV